MIVPALYREILAARRGFCGLKIKLKIVTFSHEAFKKATGNVKAVIRTGEFTSYADLIFNSGVVFLVVIKLLQF
jgi:D-ribose pyranose/furanose isomerase RbsD